MIPWTTISPSIRRPLVSSGRKEQYRLRLSRVAPHEWESVYPDIYNQLMEQFDTGCEFYEEGHLDEAERMFRAMLEIHIH